MEICTTEAIAAENEEVDPALFFGASVSNSVWILTCRQSLRLYTVLCTFDPVIYWLCPAYLGYTNVFLSTKGQNVILYSLHWPSTFIKGRHFGPQVKSSQVF